MSSQRIDRFVVFQKAIRITTITTCFLALMACSPKTDLKDLANGGILTLEETGDTHAILGGDEVLAGDAVAASTIGILNLRAGVIVCTGSLVSRNLVITAGHCTTEDPADLAIVFTLKLPRSTQEASQIQVRRVIAGQTHPQWPRNDFSSGKNWGDMALLRFDGDLPTGYAPVRILAKASLLAAGGEATLAGFGWTNGRRQTEATGLNKVVVKIQDPLFSDMELLFNQREGKGACHGDSGGPAFVEVQGHLVLVGITSRGHDDPDDSCEHFSIYSSLATQSAWLKSAAVELQRPEAVGKPMPQPF